MIEDGLSKHFHDRTHEVARVAGAHPFRNAREVPQVGEHQRDFFHLSPQRMQIVWWGHVEMHACSSLAGEPSAFPAAAAQGGADSFRDGFDHALPAHESRDDGYRRDRGELQYTAATTAAGVIANRRDDNRLRLLQLTMRIAGHRGGRRQTSD